MATYANWNSVTCTNTVNDNGDVYSPDCWKNAVDAGNNSLDVDIRFDPYAMRLDVSSNGQHRVIDALQLRNGNQFKLRFDSPNVSKSSDECMSKDEYDRRAKIEKKKKDEEQLIKDKKRRTLCSDNLWQ